MMFTISTQTYSFVVKIPVTVMNSSFVEDKIKESFNQFGYHLKQMLFRNDEGYKKLIEEVIEGLSNMKDYEANPVKIDGK